MTLAAQNVLGGLLLDSIGVLANRGQGSDRGDFPAIPRCSSGSPENGSERAIGLTRWTPPMTGFDFAIDLAKTSSDRQRRQLGQARGRASEVGRVFDAGNPDRAGEHLPPKREELLAAVRPAQAARMKSVIGWPVGNDGRASGALHEAGEH